MLDREGPTEVTSPFSSVPDLRVSTVTPASVQLLQSVGAWDDVAPPRSAAFQHMQVPMPHLSYLKPSQYCVAITSLVSEALKSRTAANSLRSVHDSFRYSHEVQKRCKMRALVIYSEFSELVH